MVYLVFMLYQSSNHLFTPVRGNLWVRNVRPGYETSNLGTKRLGYETFIIRKMTFEQLVF